MEDKFSLLIRYYLLSQLFINAFLCECYFINAALIEQCNCVLWRVYPTGVRVQRWFVCVRACVCMCVNENIRFFGPTDCTPYGIYIHSSS